MSRLIVNVTESPTSRARTALINSCTNWISTPSARHDDVSNLDDAEPTAAFEHLGHERAGADDVNLVAETIEGHRHGDLLRVHHELEVLQPPFVAGLTGGNDHVLVHDVDCRISPRLKQLEKGERLDGTGIVKKKSSPSGSYDGASSISTMPCTSVTGPGEVARYGSRIPAAMMSKKPSSSRPTAAMPGVIRRRRRSGSSGGDGYSMDGRRSVMGPLRWYFETTF